MIRIKPVMIWTFGMLAAVIFSGFVAHIMAEAGNEVFGVLFGISAFICARLWITEDP